MQVHLVVIGKLKDKSLEEIETNYLKRIKDPFLKIHEVRGKAEDKQLEAQAIFKKVQSLTKKEKTFLVALAETGKQFDSSNFSKWLIHKIETYQHLVFVIAGAEGHDELILKAAQAQLSLSSLTFPHKLARIIFVEQFYRALSIREGHPYHN